VAGKDASKQFWKYHNEAILKKYKGKLQIGSLDSKKAAAPPPKPAAPAASPSASKSKAISEAKPTKSETPLDPFGDLVPFADPSWYQGVCFLGKNRPVRLLLIVVQLPVPLPILQ
jgi:hypothetical protein